MATKAKARFVVCVNNAGYAASLEPRKIYESLPDDQAAQTGHVRVMDESGEDYLFPAEFFLEIDLPSEVEAALKRAS